MSDLSLSNENVIDSSNNSSTVQPITYSNEPVEVNFEKSIKLTDEEKKKLDAAKKKNVQTKVAVAKVENYNSNEFKMSDEEMAQCLELQKDFGGFLSDKIDMEPGTGIVETLPTGVDVLDCILGGGFGVGTLSLIVGNPGTFKSSLLAQVMGTSQRKFKGKLISTYLDSEEAMTSDRLAQMGVRLPPIKPYNDITVEQVFKTIEGQCAYKELKNLTHVPSIVAWDSVANTITEKDRDAENQNSTIGLKARVLSFALPKYISKMKKYNVALIAINQLREKLEMGITHTQNDLRYLGQDKTMPGGQALKYNGFHVLHLKIVGDLKVEQWGFNGVMLEAKCAKNKLFTPNVPVKLIVNFTSGISNFWTNYKLLTDESVLKAGAWNHLTTKPQLKFRTKDAEQLYNSNTDGFRDAFDAAVKMTIKTSIYDKYKSAAKTEVEVEELEAEPTVVTTVDLVAEQI